MKLFIKNVHDLLDVWFLCRCCAQSELKVHSEASCAPCLEVRACRDKQGACCLSGLSVCMSAMTLLPKPSRVKLASSKDTGELGQVVSLLCGAVAVFLGRFGVASGFRVK